jgi:uncharacterized protein (DUF2141 family)
MRITLLFFFALLVYSQKAVAQTFTVIDSLPIGAYGTAAWGDFDGDGKKDLAYITQTATAGQPDIFNVYHNTPSGLVKLAHSFMHLYTPAAVWGDLNNDGKEDLVVSGMKNTTLESVIQVFQSHGNGNFTLINDTLEGLSVGSLDIADYDNDGFKDIAACGYTNSSNVVSVIYRNTGNFQFQDIHASLQGSSGGELRWCDYDKDGKQDLAISGLYAGTSRTLIYHNEGNDSFLLVSPYMKGGSGTLDWVDYDSNGFFDLLTAGVDSSGAHNYTDLYRNNGNGSFTKLTNFNSPKFGEPVATDVADFDGDGKTDIWFAGGNDSFFLFSAYARNTGTPLFSFSPVYKTDIQNCIVAAADIDNDGDQDLLLSNFILRNNGATGLNDPSQQMKVALYPNPARDKLFVTGTTNTLHAVLYSSIGIRMMEAEVRGGEAIDVSCYAPGVYMLLLSDVRSTLMKNIVIQH